MEPLSFRGFTIYVFTCFLLGAYGFSQSPRKHSALPIPKIADKEFPEHGELKIIATCSDRSMVVYREVDNGDATLKRLYRIDQWGEILKKSPLFSGEYISYGNLYSFFIWGAEFGSIEKHAHLWNALNGEDIQINQDGNPMKGGIFGNGDGFWIQYYLKDGGVDATRIVVYDAGGKISATKIFRKAGVFEYAKGKSKYTVRINKPEFPY